MENNMEDLNLDSILSGDELENLFVSPEEESKEESQESSPDKEDKKDTTTEDLNIDTLFESPESVGSEENQETGEDTTETKDSGASPNNNFYSSIAKALKEDGVFPDLDDADADAIKEAEDLANVIEKQVQARLDEKQRRIDEALSVGVEDNIIRQYENTLSYLEGIKEDDLKAEDEQGETLRKQLIYQDLLNRGYSKEEATEELDDIFKNGSDIRKAVRALNGNKEYFSKQYQSLVDKAKEEAEEEKKALEKRAASLKKSILEDSKVFGELSIDKPTRQKVYDNISKPVYKDKETGELFTALQKYEKENKEDFLKNVGLLFTLTDGFKNIDALVNNKVKKEVKKGLRELEHTLNNTSRSSNGVLRFVSGVEEDPESSLRGWDLDI